MACVLSGRVKLPSPAEMLEDCRAFEWREVHPIKCRHAIPNHPLQNLAQAKWVACVLSGRAALPLPAEMLEDCRAFERRHLAAGLPLRYLHCQVPCSKTDLMQLIEDGAHISRLPVFSTWRQSCCCATCTARRICFSVCHDAQRAKDRLVSCSRPLAPMSHPAAAVISGTSS